MPGRLVVVLCGPPGAGKTTTARANPYGLKVYDQDDPTWTSSGAFVRALSEVGQDPNARAVVIRSGATSSARIKARALTQATHCFLLPMPRELAMRNVRSRARNVARGIRGVTQWWRIYDTRDRTPAFPGWDRLGAASLPPARHDPKTKYPTQVRDYGYHHRQVRAAYAQRMADGEVFICRWCGRPVDPRLPWDLGHADGQRGYTGPEHPKCNRKAGQRGAVASRLDREREWIEDVVARRDEPQTRRW